MKEIKLSKSDKVALVDDEDYDYLSKITWQEHSPKRGHTAARGTIHLEHNGYKWFRQEYMHRVIMNAQKGDQVDHIDHNPLNNQKSNLRICSHQENMWNQRKPRLHKGKRPLSKYKGVSKMKSKVNGKEYSYWHAQVVHNKKHHHLGVFKTEEEAAIAYDDFCRKHRGEFANLNFPDD